MTSDGWQIPSELEGLISAGRWPRDENEAGKQHFRPLVPVERIRAFAPNESSIYFQNPPFYSVRQLIGQHKFERQWWHCADAAPNEISFKHSVPIGDFGIGSDAPILLDYRLSHHCPSVLRVVWGTKTKVGDEYLRIGPQGQNHWVGVAPNFRAFAELLGLVPSARLPYN